MVVRTHQPSKHSPYRNAESKSNRPPAGQYDQKQGSPESIKQRQEQIQPFPVPMPCRFWCIHLPRVEVNTPWGINLARFNPDHDAEPIYESAKTWGQHCLVEDGSILSRGMKLWTPEILDELDTRFVQNLDEGEGDFFGKLEAQLSGGTPECYRLMAEVLWILMLFQSNIGASKKRLNISQVWEWSEVPIPELNPYFSDEVLSGLGSAGTAYNTQRWRELSFLITTVRAFKQQDQLSRENMLTDGWKFAKWLSSIDGSRNRQLRQILPHLLFPEIFERISSEKDKRLILASQLGLAQRDIRKWDLNKIDGELLELRTKLEKELSRDIDFYEDEFLGVWRDSIRSWLLCWYPETHSWSTLRGDRAKTCLGELVTLPWPCASLLPREGDRIFLIRAGAEPMGIVAFGRVGRAPYDASHSGSDWNEHTQGSSSVIDVDFVSIRDVAFDPILPLETIQRELPDQTWTSELSGIEIKSKAARRLYRLWQDLPSVLLDNNGQTDSRSTAVEKAEPLNLILYGPPGTGKTYRLMQTHMPRYRDKDGDRFEFITFHQSYAYEDFVEGIRPVTVDGSITYEVRSGVLRRIAERARQDPGRRYALFIDEINRGNVAKIFGELITLIEADKRVRFSDDGEKKGLEVTLPYSGELFGVPANLDVIATMNTADRSISLLDTALRRRFQFEELSPNSRFIDSHGSGFILDDDGVRINLRELLESINARLTHLLHRDQTIGHAYFTKVKTFAELRAVMAREIIPLLQEYFYDDWRQIRLVLADHNVDREDQLIRQVIMANSKVLFPNAEIAQLGERHVFEVVPEAEITPDSIRKIYENEAL